MLLTWKCTMKKLPIESSEQLRQILTFSISKLRYNKFNY